MEACEDYDTVKCGKLARKGRCKTNQEVAVKCKASCGMCPDSTYNDY